VPNFTRSGLGPNIQHSENDPEDREDEEDEAKSEGEDKDGEKGDIKLMVRADDKYPVLPEFNIMTPLDILKRLTRSYVHAVMSKPLLHSSSGYLISHCVPQNIKSDLGEFHGARFMPPM
jgi:hypothetical protein